MDRFSQTLSRHFPVYRQSWQYLQTLLKAGTKRELYAYLSASLQHCGLAVQSLEHENLGLLLYGGPQTDSTRTLFIYTDYHQQELPHPHAASIIACLAAFDIYFQHQRSPSMNIRWLLGNKKASSLSTFREFVMNNQALFWADGGLWFDGETMPGATAERAQLALGAKGLLRVECSIQAMQTEFLSHYGTIIPNAAWRLLWALGSLKDKHEDILIDGFYDSVFSYEDDILADLAEPMESSFQREQEAAEHLLPGLHDSRQIAYTHYLTPTCTITALKSGNSDPQETEADDLPEYAIPTGASALIDFHLVPNQAPQEIFTRLKQHLHQQGFADVSVQQLYASAPTYTASNAPFVQAVRQATTQAYGQTPTLFPVVPRHIPLAPLQQLSMPVIVAIPPSMKQEEDAALIGQIKQILLSMDALGKIC